MAVWYRIDQCPPPHDVRLLAVCVVCGRQSVHLGKFQNGEFVSEEWHGQPIWWMPLPKTPKEMSEARYDFDDAEEDDGR